VKKKETIDILFLIFDLGILIEESTVYQSQVCEQLIFLQKQGYKTSLLTVYKEWNKFNKVIGARLGKTGVKVFLRKDNRFLLNFLNVLFLMNALTNRYNFRKIYVRGMWSSTILYFLSLRKSFPYVFDSRADTIDESLAIGASKLKISIYRHLEKIGIEKATNVTAVSKPLSVMLKKTYKINEVDIIPCCLAYENFIVRDEDRFKIRKLLNFSMNSIVFVYSGGLSYYQQIPYMLKLWSMFIDWGNIEFLLLTNDDVNNSPSSTPLIKQFKGRITHMTVARHEIPQYLAAADIGFMLRDQRNLNKVASPVKFPEYLSAGLAVISSPNVGDVSSIILDNDVGLLINPYSVEEGVLQLSEYLTTFVACDKEIFRARCRSLSQNLYTWEAYRNVFNKLYKEN